MTWRTRPNGDLDVAVLRSMETALGPDDVVALRLEHSARPGVTDASQFVMSPDDAEVLGAELIAAAQLARTAQGRA